MLYKIVIPIARNSLISLGFSYIDLYTFKRAIILEDIQLDVKFYQLTSTTDFILYLEYIYYLFSI